MILFEKEFLQVLEGMAALDSISGKITVRTKEYAEDPETWTSAMPQTGFMLREMPSGRVFITGVHSQEEYSCRAAFIEAYLKEYRCGI